MANFDNKKDRANRNHTIYNSIRYIFSSRHNMNMRCVILVSKPKLKNHILTGFRQNKSQ